MMWTTSHLLKASQECPRQTSMIAPTPSKCYHLLELVWYDQSLFSLILSTILILERLLGGIIDLATFSIMGCVLVHDLCIILFEFPCRPITEWTKLKKTI